MNTLCRDYREQYQVDWRDDFVHSIDKVMDEPVDIFLGNHTAQNQCLDKYQRLARGERNPFVDREAWRAFLTDLKYRFNRMLEEERLGMDQR